MAMDFFMIIMSAFALFGFYCFAEFIAETFAVSKVPPSVVIMKNISDEKTFQKIKYIQENLPNNYTVLYPFGEAYGEGQQGELLCRYLNEVLDVNN